MDYKNINVCSETYKKLSDAEKLKVVKEKMNMLFNEDGKHLISLYHKDNKVTVVSSKKGIYKDLRLREKSLEKKVSQEIIDSLNKEIFNGNKDNNVIDTFTADNSSKVTVKVKFTDSKNVTSIENKIKELKSELNTLWRTGSKEEGKGLIGVSIKGQSKYFPYATCVLISKKKKELDTLKKGIVSVKTEEEVIKIQDEKTNIEIVSDDLKQDVTSDINKDVKENKEEKKISESNGFVFIELPISSDNVKNDEINKETNLPSLVVATECTSEVKDILPESKYHEEVIVPNDNDKEETEEEFKNFWEKMFKSVENNHDNLEHEETNVHDQIKNSENKKEELEQNVKSNSKKQNKGKKKSKKGILGGLFAVPFVATLANKWRNKKAEEDEKYDAINGQYDIIDETNELSETKSSSRWDKYFNALFYATLKDEKNDLVISQENNIIENKKEENKKDKKKRKGIFGWLLAVPFIALLVSKWKNRKVKNVTLLDNATKKRKKIATAVCAFILAGATLFTAFIGKNSKKDKTSDTGETFNPSYVTTPDDDLVSGKEDITIEEVKPEDNPIISDTPVIEEPVTPVLPEENINYTLNDVVTINDESRIYTNSYDATYGTNSYIAYFDGSNERDIRGVVYELNGNVYTIYDETPNASELIADLESKGAIQTAVLVTRSDLLYTNQYEGYYCVDSVKVKSRVR